MKTAVSIPDDLFLRADVFAKRTGKSRSELYADALREHLIRQADPATTARLNEVYADHDPGDEERRWLTDVTSGLVARNEW